MKPEVLELVLQHLWREYFQLDAHIDFDVLVKQINRKDFLFAETHLNIFVEALRYLHKENISIDVQIMGAYMHMVAVCIATKTMPFKSLADALKEFEILTARMQRIVEMETDNA